MSNDKPKAKVVKTIELDRNTVMDITDGGSFGIRKLDDASGRRVYFTQQHLECMFENVEKIRPFKDQLSQWREDGKAVRSLDKQKAKLVTEGQQYLRAGMERIAATGDTEGLKALLAEIAQGLEKKQA